MPVMIIDNEIREKIKWVVEYAISHPFTWEDLLAMSKNQIKKAGDRLEHKMIIPRDYEIVFSISTSPENIFVKHISISTRGVRYAQPDVVKEIIKEFGFVNGLEHPNEVVMDQVGKLIHVVENL